MIVGGIFTHRRTARTNRVTKNVKINVNKIILIILDAKYSVNTINANTQARRQRTFRINCDQNSTKSTPLLSLTPILTESLSNKN